MTAEVGSVLALMALVFLGATVSAYAGFAGLGGAGAILLHILPPQHVIPLIMLCSIGTQLACLMCLRPRMAWRMIGASGLGGLVGVALALPLMSRIDPALFRAGFGWFLVAYAVYMLTRSRVVPLASGRLRIASLPLVGLAGGLVGGLTAMPGAVPTLWCDLHGVPKDDQRGIVQPFMVVTQGLAMLILLNRPGHDTAFLSSFAFALPAVVAGTWLGLRLYGHAGAITFRRAVLALLLASGASLVL